MKNKLEFEGRKREEEVAVAADGEGRGRPTVYQLQSSAPLFTEHRVTKSDTVTLMDGIARQPVNPRGSPGVRAG
jgi:hypothetical protein